LPLHGRRIEKWLGSKGEIEGAEKISEMICFILSKSSPSKVQKTQGNNLKPRKKRGGNVNTG
jgi:hypothetical protein